MFFKRHILRDRIGRFDSNIDMAEAWQRLAEGNFFASDLRLLIHEYAELILLNSRKITADNAHSLTEAFYSWEKFLQG